jgi:glucose-6-phosphate isomerase
VFGNKGGTDAHAYIQQLNDGRDDFLVTFIEVLCDAEHVLIDNGVTMGDYLHAFKDGLVAALRRKRRQVISLTVERVDAANLGMLIALYERAVAVYAELVHINAFHQPGVQAYKLASGEVNKVNLALQVWLSASCPAPWTGAAEDLALAAGLAGQEQVVAGWLAKFAANGRRFGSRTVRRAFADGRWLYSVG